MTNTIVQYVIVRTDLISSLKWSVGAVIAQACHATTAAAMIFKDDPVTIKYFSDMENMHKIVLGISSETKLMNLSKRLKEEEVLHHVWIEKPENTPTCLVTKPGPKKDVASLVRKLQLFRMPSDHHHSKNKHKEAGNVVQGSGDKEGVHEKTVEDKDRSSGSGGESKGDDINNRNGIIDTEAMVEKVKERMSNSPKLPPIDS